MLVELLIENYAVIDQLRVRFYPGMNALTGETGSGKSIVVDALGLLFGGRASAEMVRTGSERARVSGIFDVPDDPDFRAVLENAGIPLEEEELLVEREILASGKSRAFAASRPVTAAVLRELAPFLGEIHGQHDQQRLFQPDFQRELLDQSGGTEELIGEIAKVYQEWRACSTQLAEIDRTEQEKLRLLDLWNFQRKEIETIKPQPGEDAALENERRVLQNVNKIQGAASAAYETLYEAEDSVHAQMRISLKRLDELTRIDESICEITDTLKPAVIAVQEASHVLRDYLGKLEADPDRLEEVESRLASLDKLKRKYGSTIEEIVAFLDDVKRQISGVESAGERRAEILKRQAALEEQYRKIAERLTARRQEAARKLEKKVEAELKSLAMERTRFRIQITPAAWSEHGADGVEFLMSANLGEEPKPMDKIASGGELSRVALALKACVAIFPSQTVRTMVFDEVDAGIGGVAAESVGRRLRQIAEGSQVLCVTHLAQIAGFADHHYTVSKQVSKGRTLSAIEELTGEARTREIGRMLSGQHLTPEALRHAEQLIRGQ